MNVENKTCIRRLSFRQMKAERSRNFISIFAIMLTTLLFTSLFTIIFSLNSSYEEYNFRQIGGYCHGTFKEVYKEQITALSSHKKIKAFGLRTVCGLKADKQFNKVHAEISFMDANTAKWSYAYPTTGRMPENGMEIAMDTEALKQMGIKPELGTKVELTYKEGNGLESDPVRTDTFTLVGFWKYDELMPVHYINVTKDYVEKAELDYISSGGDSFRTDMNVMLTFPWNIRGEMEQIDSDLGYQWTDTDAENCVRIGVNSGYSTQPLLMNMDITMLLAIIVLLLLVFVTGYLIINNVFRISVSNDILFYGTLKTIGTTPRQLKRIVHLQAVYLSLGGIPLGCLLGYGIGLLITPRALSASSGGLNVYYSASPVIFIMSSVFAILTVFLSCMSPASKVARLTPIDALRYTEQTSGKRKNRATHGSKISKLAYANLGRNRIKTILVILSLALTVVLLNCVVSFAGGFDMEKYLSKKSVKDFVVGSADYFKCNGSGTGISDEMVYEISQNTSSVSKGSVYDSNHSFFPVCWVDKNKVTYLTGGDETVCNGLAKRDSLYGMDLLLEGFDESLLETLIVCDGSLKPLLNPEKHAIALALDEDDYGNIINVPANVGDEITVTYIDEENVYDNRTGKLADEDTPEEYMEYRVEKGHDVTYTVCALVKIPYAMSYRFSTLASIGAVITSDALEQDMGKSPRRMLYAFDSEDEISEKSTDKWLAGYTANDSNGLNYESKEQLRKEFTNFKNTFLLVGMSLCFIVGLVGILNYFNAILTGIMTRRREFAMLQSVGMTWRQLKKMLILEGVYYAIGAGILSILIAMIISPLLGNLLETVFWFFSYRFVIWPVFAIIPVFLLLGIILPVVIYHFAERQTIVERLR